MLGRHRNGYQGHEHQRHGRQHHPALPYIADHHAKGVTQGRRYQQDGQHFQKIGERRGVFERMGGIGVEKAAAVGAQLLDGDLRGRRPKRQGLLFGFGGFGDRLTFGIHHGFAVRIQFRGLITDRFL